MKLDSGSVRAVLTGKPDFYYQKRRQSYKFIDKGWGCPHTLVKLDPKSLIH